MARFDTIKTAIDANINTNGKQDITGGKMNSVLKQMVDATDAELTELETEVGKIQTTISVTNGMEHSSLKDQLIINAKEGEKIELITSSSDGNTAMYVQYFGYVGDGTDGFNLGTAKLGQKVTTVLAQNCKSIGIYFLSSINAVLSFSVKQRIAFKVSEIDGLVVGVVEKQGEEVLSNLLTDNIFDNDNAAEIQFDANGGERPSDMHTSDYIYCHGKEYVSTNYGGRNNAYHCFYDINKNFISSVPTAQIGGYVIPTHAYYVRLSMSAYSAKNYAAFVNSTKLTDADYVPFKSLKDAIEENAAAIANLPNSIKDTTYGFVRCTTASDVATKVVSIPNLKIGENMRFIMQMDYPTSVDAQLSINGGTAYPIIYNGSFAFGNNTWQQRENLDVTFNKNYPAYMATTRAKLTQSKGSGADFVMSQKAVTELVESVKNEIGENAGTSARALNEDKMTAIASMTCRVPNLYGELNRKKCVALAIMTDVHSDFERFERVCEFADNTDEIDGTLALGDIIETSAHGNPYSLITRYDKPIIPIVGNHEVIKGSYFEGWSEDDLLANMFNAEQVAHNGEVHPTGKCYWHRDFTRDIDGVTRTLRVIGLHSYEGNGEGNQNSGAGKDVTFYSQEQIDWLVARLDEVDANTKVIIAIHYPPTIALTRIDCPFTPSEYLGISPAGGSNTGGANSMSDNLFLPKIIQAWIEGKSVNATCEITVGGTVTTISVNKTFSAHAKQFAGWVAGHTHQDFISSIDGFAEQKVMVFTCSTNAERQQGCDLGRTESGKSQDAFTIISVDWFKNRVNLVRIGADVTCDMKERKYFNFEL